jgi:four helix bundle protein
MSAGPLNANDLKFHFEELVVYQKSLDFIDSVYKITEKFPREEQFRLNSQFIRAAHSIALNIADGSGGTKAEFRNFLRISKRSTRECIVCLSIAYRQKYIDSNTEIKIRLLAIEISKMLNGLIKSIR